MNITAVLLKTINDALPMLILVASFWAFLRLVVYVGTEGEAEHQAQYKVAIGAHKKRLSALE